MSSIRFHNDNIASERIDKYQFKQPYNSDTENLHMDSIIVDDNRIYSEERNPQHAVPSSDERENDGHTNRDQNTHHHSHGIGSQSFNSVSKILSYHDFSDEDEDEDDDDESKVFDAVPSWEMDHVFAAADETKQQMKKTETRKYELQLQHINSPTPPGTPTARALMFDSLSSPMAHRPPLSPNFIRSPPTAAAAAHEPPLHSHQQYTPHPHNTENVTSHIQKYSSTIQASPHSEMESSLDHLEKSLSDTKRKLCLRKRSSDSEFTEITRVLELENKLSKQQEFNDSLQQKFSTTVRKLREMKTESQNHHLKKDETNSATDKENRLRTENEKLEKQVQELLKKNEDALAMMDLMEITSKKHEKQLHEKIEEYELCISDLEHEFDHERQHRQNEKALLQSKIESLEQKVENELGSSVDVFRKSREINQLKQENEALDDENKHLLRENESLRSENNRSMTTEDETSADMEEKLHETLDMLESAKETIKDTELRLRQRETEFENLEKDFEKRIMEAEKELAQKDEKLDSLELALCTQNEQNPSLLSKIASLEKRLEEELRFSESEMDQMNQEILSLNQRIRLFTEENNDLHNRFKTCIQVTNELCAKFNDAPDCIKGVQSSVFDENLKSLSGEKSPNMMEASENDEYDALESNLRLVREIVSAIFDECSDLHNLLESKEDRIEIMVANEAVLKENLETTAEEKLAAEEKSLTLEQKIRDLQGAFDQNETTLRREEQNDRYASNEVEIQSLMKKIRLLEAKHEQLVEDISEQKQLTENAENRLRESIRARQNIEKQTAVNEKETHEHHIIINEVKHDKEAAERRLKEEREAHLLTKTQLGELQDKLECSNTEIQGLLNRVDSQKQTMSSLRNSLQKSVEKFENEVEIAQNEAQEVKSELSDQVRTTARQQRDLARLNDEIKTQKETNEELTSEVHLLRKKLLESSSETGKVRDFFQQKLDEEQEQHIRTKEMTEEIKNTLVESESTITSLEDAINSRNETIAALRTDLSRCAETTEKQFSNIDLEDKLIKSEQLLSSSLDKINHLTTTIKSLEDEITNRMEEDLFNKKEILELNELMSDTTISLEQSKLAISMLEKQLESEREEKISTTNVLESNESLTETVETLRSQVLNHKKENMKLSDEIAKLKETLRTKTIDFDRSNSIASCLTEDIDEKIKENSILRKSMKNLEDKILVLDHEKGGNNVLVSSLEDELTARKKESEALKLKVSSLEKELNIMKENYCNMNELKHKLSSYQETIETFEERRESMEEKLQTMAGFLEKANKNQSSLQLQLESSRKEAREFKEAEQHARSNAETLQSKISSYKKSFQDQNKIIAQLKDQLQRSAHDLEEADAKIASLMAQNETGNLQREVDELRLAISDRDEKIEQLQDKSQNTNVSSMWLQLESSRKEAREFKEAEQHVRSIAEKLQSKISSYEKSSHDQKEVVAKLKDQLQKSAHDLEEADAKIASLMVAKFGDCADSSSMNETSSSDVTTILQREVDELRLTVSNRDTKIAELHKSLQTTRVKLDESESNILSLRKQIELDKKRYQQTIIEMEKHMEKRLVEVKRMAERKTNVDSNEDNARKSELQENQQMIKMLEEKVEMQKMTITSLRLDMKELGESNEIELIQLQRELEKVKEESGQQKRLHVENKIHQLERQLQSKSEDLVRERLINTNLRDEISRIKNHLTRSESMVNESTNSLRELERKLMSKDETHRLETFKLGQENKNIMFELNQEKENHIKTKKALESKEKSKRVGDDSVLQNENDALSREQNLNDSLKTEVVVLKKTLSKMEKHIEIIEKELAGKEKHIERLNDDILDHTKKLDLMRNNLDDCNDNPEFQTKINGEVSEENKNLKAQIRRISSKSDRNDGVVRNLDMDSFEHKETSLAKKEIGHLKNLLQLTNDALEQSKKSFHKFRDQSLSERKLYRSKMDSMKKELLKLKKDQEKVKESNSRENPSERLTQELMSLTQTNKLYEKSIYELMKTLKKVGATFRNEGCTLADTRANLSDDIACPIPSEHVEKVNMMEKIKIRILDLEKIVATQKDDKDQHTMLKKYQSKVKQLIDLNDLLQQRLTELEQEKNKKEEKIVTLEKSMETITKQEQESKKMALEALNHAKKLVEKNHLRQRKIRQSVSS